MTKLARPENKTMIIIHGKQRTKRAAMQSPPHIAHIAENNKRAKVPKTIELIVNIPNDIL